MRRQCAITACSSDGSNRLTLTATTSSLQRAATTKAATIGSATSTSAAEIGADVCGARAGRAANCGRLRGRGALERGGGGGERQSVAAVAGARGDGALAPHRRYAALPRTAACG